MNEEAPAKLSHVDDRGRPRMVDVSDKEVTVRSARAEGRILTAPATVERLGAGPSAKGRVLEVAELAGIMAAKRTSELIPLCHVLAGATVRVELEIDPSLPGVVARSEAVVADRTGVEMEALTAVAVALLTVYDMLKSVDRSMRIDGVRLLSKEGGRSGRWTADG